MKYNGIHVPPLIRTDRIMSAFENYMDMHKVEEYADAMSYAGLCHEFPPIQGFPFIIDEDDVGDMFLNGDVIDEKLIGHLAWKVTDGHHRSLAAIKANLPHLEVTLDYSCITNEEDLKQFK